MIRVLIFLALSVTAYAGTLRPCEFKDVQGQVDCGELQVLENPADQKGRKISLKIIVLRALDQERKASDPLFFLTGGPGQAATDMVQRAAEELAELRKTRDVVFVDQRGTGGSNPLTCLPYPAGDIRLYLGPPPEAENIRNCRTELEKRADLRFYTTPYAIQDLEDVRAALGYQKINLDGASYGTRVALAYLQKYERNVRSVVIKGVSTPYISNSLNFGSAGQKALDALFDRCEKDPECSRAYPEFRKETYEVLKRVDAKPVDVTISHPSNGKEVRGIFTGDILATRIHLILFLPTLAARLPHLIHEAYLGNYAPVAQLSVDFGKAIFDQIYFGMQLSVVCSEEIPFEDREEIGRRMSETFLGKERFERFFDYCNEWRRGIVADDYRKPVRSSVPTLIISGELDPATPPSNGEEVKRHLDRSRHLIIPQGSHIGGGECIKKIATAFIENLSLESLDTSCLSAPSAEPFFVSAGS